MKYPLRMLLVWLRSFRAPRLGVDDVCRTPLRVVVGDLDWYRHVNNGTYLTLADLGRLDWMLRTGLWKAFGRRGWYPIIANSTTTYRRTLHLGQQLVIETRLLGADAKSIYIEHRFVVDGEVHARTILRGRLLSKEGTLKPAQVQAQIPALATLPDRVPEWVLRWGEDTKLPPSRAEFPSVWDDEPGR